MQSKAGNTEGERGRERRKEERRKRSQEKKGENQYGRDIIHDKIQPLSLSISQ
jgi:hypothetical protein